MCQVLIFHPSTVMMWKKPFPDDSTWPGFHQDSNLIALKVKNDIDDGVSIKPLYTFDMIVTMIHTNKRQ